MLCLRSVIAFVVLSFSLASGACDLWGGGGIFHTHTHTHGGSDNSVILGGTGIDERTYNKVMARIERIYAPIVSSYGYNLKILRRWKFTPLNAYAERIGGDWIVAVFGGLARHPLATEDAIALITCHEIGHHLGGVPKIPDAPDWGIEDSWLSTEGQADYFASLKCFRKYAMEDNNVALVNGMHIPLLVRIRCNTAFFDPEKSAICQRNAMAGHRWASIHNLLMGNKVPLYFATPDKSIVSRTKSSYPSAQCRLDTYFSAAICPIGHEIALSDSDPNIGVCSRFNGDILGTRPLCWYSTR